MKFYYKLILLVILLILSTSLFSQSKKALDLYNEAKQYYDDDKYLDAIETFRLAIDDYPNYHDAINYLGASYYYNEEYDLAIEQFEKLQKMNPKYWAWYYYWWGLSLDAKGEYDKAKDKFHKFIDKYPDSPKYKLYRNQAKFKMYYDSLAPVIRNKPKSMDEPINLGTTINTEWGDYMPQLNPTGKIMYFTSDRKGSPFNKENGNSNGWGEDIYKMEKTDKGWTNPKPLPEPINSVNNDGSASFSGDGQSMVYVVCGKNDGIGNCDLYIAKLEGDKWSEPENLGNIVNSKVWDSQPSFSADGNTIIFSSEREGGLGGNDLYMIQRNIFGDWGGACNLGAIINSPFSETSPFLSSDGKTLYFSSNGHPGYGNYDIFKSVFKDGKWSIPENIGAPLNSSGSDMYFTIGGSGEVGYFASDRDGGLGRNDLYSIKIPEAMRPTPTVVVTGVVSSAKDKKAVSSWVLVEDIETGELIASSKSNSLTGKYLIVLPSGRNYSVSANKEGFFFYSTKYEVPKGTKYQEFTLNISLKPLEKGAKVVLNNIFFETGKAALTGESKVELDKAVELMKVNPTMKIEVSGHTDNVGALAANMNLSTERAKSVYTYLLKAGIAAERLQAKGYGPNNPIADNTTPDGRKANRRTEFLIIEY